MTEHVENSLLRAWLVVPSYGEEVSIARCLDAVDRACLPTGVSWGRWVVVDGASPDATAAVAEAWAVAHPDRTLHVLREPERRGKLSALEHVRRQFIAGAGHRDVLVGVDADVEVDDVALARLLAPFLGDPMLTVAWGGCRPHGSRRGRRASTFQMELVHDLATARGPLAVRAEGRLWALRPQRIPEFAWAEGSVVDDLQLAEAAAGCTDGSVSTCSIPDAVAWTRPAAGWVDFHHQTSRFLRSRAVLAVERKVQASPGSADEEAAVSTVRVAIRAICRDPQGFAAYAVARAVDVAWTALGPSESLLKWPIARSSKGNVSQPARQASGLWSKVALLGRTVLLVGNWPAVLANWFVAHWPAQLQSSATFHFALRDGTTMACRRDVSAAWPVFEVLIADAYKLQQLRTLLPEPPGALVDVGAHVGSAAVAVARCFPGVRVVAAEPSGTSAALLRQKLQANAVDGEVVDAAVGATAGWAALDEGSPGACENVATPVSPETPPAATLVPMVAFADLVDRAGPAAVLVKMDCEGAEYDIVEGTAPEVWRTVVAVLLEYHPIEGCGGWPWIAGRFTELGFAVAWHEPRRPGLGTACFVRRD